MIDEVAVSVVVPTIGRGRLLRACLASVAACRPRASEVLVVDQSGGSQVEAIVASFEAHGVRRVADAGRGIGRAANLGLREARHDVVLITHDDCTIEPEWVKTGARLMAERPDGIITGRVLPVGDPRLVPTQRTDPDPVDYTGTRKYAILYPLCMGCSRRALLEFGGFDERIVPAAEDNDLGYRWLKARRTIRYTPELTVWHHGRRSRSELRAAYKGYAFSDGMVYAKHLRAGDLTMLVRIARHLKWALRGLAGAVRHPQQRWWDPRLGILGPLARGLRQGWRMGAAGHQR